jgi:hypothetical protein
MRNISFMLTTPQFLDGSKDVTRRMGWLFLKAGDVLMAVEKSQGLGKGGRIKRLGMIKIVSVRREPLRRMTDEPEYGCAECRREGFPKTVPGEFVEMFRKSHKGCVSSSIITRIEFEHITIA